MKLLLTFHQPEEEEMMISFSISSWTFPFQHWMQETCSRDYFNWLNHFPGRHLYHVLTIIIQYRASYQFLQLCCFVLKWLSGNCSGWIISTNNTTLRKKSNKSKVSQRGSSQERPTTERFQNSKMSFMFLFKNIEVYKLINDWNAGAIIFVTFGPNCPGSPITPGTPIGPWGDKQQRYNS